MCMVDRTAVEFYQNGYEDDKSGAAVSKPSKNRKL